ncbi:hypothetical protein KA977_08040 [Candidatus Dependentiae bacterium]|nr:hypothetical protein [Candidatus Dependentiae bacterium]
MLKKIVIALMSVLLISALAFAADEAAAPAADDKAAVKADVKDAGAADAKKADKPKYANGVKIVSCEGDKLVVSRGYGKKAKEETYAIGPDTKYYKDKKPVKAEEVAALFVKDVKVNVGYVKDGDKLIAKRVYLNTKQKKAKKDGEAPAAPKEEKAAETK